VITITLSLLRSPYNQKKERKARTRKRRRTRHEGLLKLQTNLSNNSRGDISEAKIRVRHVTTIYFP
jgi:hypothetical protein